MYPSSQPSTVCSLSISITRPSGTSRCHRHLRGSLRHPDFLAGLIHGFEFVGLSLIRTEDPEILRFFRITSRSRSPGLGFPAMVVPGLSTSTAYWRKSGRRRGLRSSRRWQRGWRSSAGSPWGPVPSVRESTAPARQNVFPACSFSATFQELQMSRIGGTSKGTWWARQKSSTLCPSTSLGPVQPLGERKMIMGHCGRKVFPVCRASPGSSGFPEHSVPGFGPSPGACSRDRILPRNKACTRSRGITLQLLVADPGQDRRVGDLVAIEVQNRQHRAVVMGLRNLLECQLWPRARSRPRRPPPSPL